MGIKIEPLGDSALKVSFGSIINESIHKEIQQFASGLQAANIKGVIEWVPTYTAVTIFYKPEIISYAFLEETVQKLSQTQCSSYSIQPIVYEIPVYYGGEAGPDLPQLSEYLQLSKEEIIKLHSGREYLIYMIGFVPGFPYLGGLPELLAAPRLQHPRPSVPEGSVGIGGSQTGIYPAEVPSGWRIIGRTPVKLFDISNEPPVLLSAGNYVQFVPIPKKEFLQIQAEKDFQIRTYKKRD